MKFIEIRNWLKLEIQYALIFYTKIFRKLKKMEAVTINETPDETIDQVFADLKQNFRNLRTMPLSFRKTQLQKFINVYKQHEEALTESIIQDLGGDRVSAYLVHIATPGQEAAHVMENIEGWSKATKTPNLVVNWPSDAFVKPEPKGVIIVLGCWNYP
jgi:aldehyde dehydrogenase (NAD+)